MTEDEDKSETEQNEKESGEENVTDADRQRLMVYATHS